MSASKWKLGIILVTLLTSSLSYSKTISSVDNSTWSMYQGNASHTGYISAQLNMNKIELLWQKKLGNDIKPVVANQDSAFVTTKDAVYRISNKEGEIVWSNKLSHLHSIGAASIDDKNLYVQTVDEHSKGLFRSYELSTGELNYKQSFSTQWRSYYAPTVSNGNTYTACGYTNAVCAYESDTGTLLWSEGLSFFQNWTPTVTEQYVITLTDVLSVFDRNSGELVFNYGKPYNVSSLWDQNGAAVVGEMDDVIYTHNDSPEFGYKKQVLRSVGLTSHQLFWEHRKEYQGQPVLGGKIVYATLANGAVEAYSELTGELLWSWENESTSSKIENLVLTNNVLLLSTEKESFAIDLDSHKTVWSFQKGGQLTLSHGMIYLSASDGDLYAFKVDVTPINPTIDVMNTSTTFGYADNYKVGDGLDVIGSAKSYNLNDGSSWDSGAGSHPIKKIKFVAVREDVDGNIHYFFTGPEDGVIFSNTDYNSGEHSAQGKLSSIGTIEIIAAPGKSTATMIGFAQITDNTPTYYEHFNYYSAKVGAVVPFKVVYEIENGVWDKSTFTHDFSYYMNGEVHFKSHDLTALVSLYKKYHSDFK